MRVCVGLSASLSASASVSVSVYLCRFLRVYTSKYLIGNRSLLGLYNCIKEI